MLVRLVGLQNLRRGVAVVASAVVLLLAATALDDGWPLDSEAWVRLAVAGALLPLAWLGSHFFLRRQEGSGAAVPSWDPHPDYVEPPSNVRRLP